MINFKLNWNDHITTSFTKVSKNTGIIFKVRLNLNKNTVLLLYRSFIQPFLDTATLSGQQVIAITTKGCFENKKKVIRANTFTKWNAHTAPLLKHLNILTVYDINKLQTLSLYTKLLTICFQNIFIPFLILI